MGQPSIKPLPTTLSLDGLTAIVTGANVGLGLETSRQLLSLHLSHLIVAVRTQSKGDIAASELRQKYPDARIDVRQLDLDDYISIRAFVQQIRDEVKELDIVVLNAGLSLMDYQTAATGHERVMQVNYYGNFLLAFGLLSLLETTSVRRGTPSRLTIVGSIGHHMHSLSWTPLEKQESIIAHFDDKKKFARFQRYNDSKLLVAAFVQQLADKVDPTHVIVNNVCPGFVASTNLDMNLPWLVRSGSSLARKVVGRTLEQGGRAIVWATVGQGPDSHGAFLNHNNISSPARILAQPEGKQLKEKLWQETINELATIDLDVTKVVA
ncbi:putative carbonyl reductase [Lipomyces kononenkoae]